MKKTVMAMSVVALTASSTLSAEELGVIKVESTRLSDVSGDEVKSADLAEALTKKLPGVSIVRRSGIANDIIVRGQKKDNINILIDNTKVYGACPNRMDPPTSHIMTNNIDSIEVVEGPYDVENFGTLSGAVKITMKEPTKYFKGEISVNAGSWRYFKTAATISGGNDKARFLVSASRETGDQYEDGSGSNFAEQIINVGAPAGNQFQAVYKEQRAYEKQTLMTKAYIDVADDQELKLSFTANRSDDILYPSSPMDALYDDSNIFNVEYTFNNLSDYSKSLEVQYYSSDVDHPMSTFYRAASGALSANEIISKLTTEMRGLKIKNSFDLDANSELTIGLDTSQRNWDGSYEGKGINVGITGNISIDDVDTENMAVFAELEKRYADVTLKTGVRYDDTNIKPTGSVGQQPNDYSAVSANVFATFKADASTKYYAGVGTASRVPDARELYFKKASGVESGTPTLKDTTNVEIDLGMEKRYEGFIIKTKVFHSWLTDYIYFHNPVPPTTPNNFENIDATIYGIEVSGTYFVSDEIYMDFGLAYQNGQKDKPLAGQTDTDLAEIPPLKVNITLSYDYGLGDTASVEFVAADAWDTFDADNGEQALSGYGVVNLKATHNVSNDFELTAGIDNVFDRTFAVSNTYKDLTLIVSGGDSMLINEPGRYLYVNGTYKF